MTEQEIRDDERRLVVEYLESQAVGLYQKAKKYFDNDEKEMSQAGLTSAFSAELLAEGISQNEHRNPIDKVG